MVSDVDLYISGLNKRSSVAPTLKARKGSDKPVISPLAVIPKLHVMKLAKYNAQSFYNLLYDKLEQSGLAQVMGQGTSSEP